MSYEELERQISIMQKPFRLVGAKGDTYFESELDAAGLKERGITSLLAASVSEDDWLLDVGANIGYMSLAMSALNPKGKVFAFEPGKVASELLKKNVKINGIKNVKVFDMGLSDKKSTATLTYSHENSSGAFINNGVVNDAVFHESYKVKLERLDDIYHKLGITKCDLIKIDIEGHEPNFFVGASKFLTTFKPMAIMEVNHWCLNIFNRTTLPDFIDLTYKHFPHIFAFHEGEYLDLSDGNSRHKFYYENTINNHFFNVYCGFDKNLMLARLNLGFGGWKREQDLLYENNSLRNENARLANSRPQKTAKKINKFLRRSH